MLKTFKSCNAKKKLKLKDRTIQLGEDANLWRRWALISSVRDIDADEVMGNCELTVTPCSLMQRDQTLYGGYHGKSDLMSTITDAVGSDSKTEKPIVQCVAIDGLCMLNRYKLPSNTKTGNDVIRAVCSWVDSLTVGCSTVIVTFNTYMDKSLKSTTRDDRYKKSDVANKGCRYYNVTATTNLSRLSMKQLLSHSKTKQSLVELLLLPLKDHLESRGVSYVVAGNHKTYSTTGDSANNHEEADILLIHCIAQHAEKSTSVYANDTDVFVLLSAHRHCINCKETFFGVTESVVNINDVCTYLGTNASICMMTVHVLTGCDTCGKFNGISKKTWINLFLNVRDDVELLQAFREFQEDRSKNTVEKLAKFVAWGYIKKKKDRVDVVNLASARCYMYKQEKADCEKIPPTLGAFLKHCDRAFHTLRQHATAHKAMIDIGDPLEHGWERIGEEYLPETTAEDIAPGEIIDLTSCKCKTNCQKGYCRCYARNVDCTDFCGCTDICENTDPATPASIVEEDIIEEKMESV